jgi:hypothetical protein
MAIAIWSTRWLRSSRATRATRSGRGRYPVATRTASASVAPRCRSSRRAALVVNPYSAALERTGV